MQNMLQAVAEFDRRFFLTVNRKQVDQLNRWIKGLTWLGSLPCQILFIIGFCSLGSTRELGLKLAIVQIAVTAIVQIVKASVSRVRPYHALTGIVPLSVEKDYSFPSGHTAASFTTAIIVGRFFPMLSVGCLGIATLIGFSRIYVGVHYPTDVVAGCFIGTTLTMIGMILIF